jgi:protein phosphatase
LRLRTGAFSDRGQVREINEDAHLVDERLALFAVADGMGGHRAGEVASLTAIEALRASIANGRPINEAIRDANDAVFEKGEGDDALAGMGTTLTAAIVVAGDRLLIGHVGDSRAYRLHDGSLERITDDHSLVEELMREGRLTPEQAESHPQRAIITRAIGHEPDVEVDVYTIDVAVGDRIILCSDGLTTMLRDRDVERIARLELDPQRACEALVDAANAAGGEDNVTVVMLDVLDVDSGGGADPELLEAALLEDGVESVTPTPVVAPDAPPRVPDEPRPRLARRVRTALFIVIPVVLVIALGVGALAWYARRSYYVGFAGEQVVLYRGVPGGVLGWDPTVEERSRLTRDQLAPVDRQNVADGAAKGSRETAERYLARLVTTASSTTTTTSTTTTSTTTSTTTPPATIAPPASSPTAIP